LSNTFWYIILQFLRILQYSDGFFFWLGWGRGCIGVRVSFGDLCGTAIVVVTHPDKRHWINFRSGMRVALLLRQASRSPWLPGFPASEALDRSFTCFGEKQSIFALIDLLVSVFLFFSPSSLRGEWGTGDRLGYHSCFSFSLRTCRGTTGRGIPEWA
jgi:hypothetical protein